MSDLEVSKAEEVTLLDGSKAQLRRADSDDNGLIEEFLYSLSEETLSFRFFDSVCERRLFLKQLIPTANNYVLIALFQGKVIGHTAYYRSGSETAEIGIMVLDAYQWKGLGTAMLEAIAKAANRNGITIFETIISKDNAKMIKMVQEMGFPTSLKREADLIRIRFPTSIDPISIEEFEAGDM